MSSKVRGKTGAPQERSSQHSVSAFLTALRAQRTPRNQTACSDKIAPERSRPEDDTDSRQDGGSTSSTGNNPQDLADDAEQVSARGFLPIDIRKLIRALPTRDKFRLMLANIGDTHRREGQDLRGEIVAAKKRVEAVEAASVVADTRLQALEEAQDRQSSKFLLMQLQLEDMEDRGCRNNLLLTWKQKGKT